MKSIKLAAMLTGMMVLAAPRLASAGFPGDALKKCGPNAVVSGTVCMDTYEASVWRVPATNVDGKSNKGLITKIKKGKVNLADLQAGDATQLGTSADDYAPCENSGRNCIDIYAVSIAEVTPARLITWFQAQQACKNAAKRLPSNAEWQAAVAGSPDPGPDNGTTDCNTNSTYAVASTGSRSSCVSADGAFDMVGNLYEWVADWVPRSTTCGSWAADVSPTGDDQCLAGAATTGGPGALIRGGDYSFSVTPPDGPLSIIGLNEPSRAINQIGFRCAR